MKKLLNKRIPVILGITLILLSIPLTTLLINNQTAFKSRASNSQEPQNVKVTNISDRFFTITYQTEMPSTSSLSYGSDKNLGESELEDIDKEKGSFSPKKIHSISVKKLTPATKYFFTIISGSNTFLDNGIPFEITTGNNISSNSAKQNDITGKIVLPDGNAPPEAIVYLNAENSQLLSSITAKDGKFHFSLKGLRTNDLSSYFYANDNTVFKIFATDGSLKSTTLASLNKISPIPTITLSNDYDFTQEISPVASKSAESLSFPSIIPSEKNSEPKLLTPEENQSFGSQKPQFRGTSLPNEKVEIIIHSDEQITTQVNADSNGNWTYQPSKDLSPGNHTITIKTRDSSGILTTITRSFTVFAAEIQIPTPTVPPAVPTQTILPTSIPTLNQASVTPPIEEPSPTQAIIESKGNVPPTGNTPVLLTIGGIIATLLGVFLFFLTHKLSL